MLGRPRGVARIEGMSKPENFFRIGANGETFDVDGYAKTSALPISCIVRRGEQNLDAGTVAELNYLEIDLGDGADLDIAEQQAIAVDFLTANEGPLRELGAAPGITSFYLGLQETVYPDSAGSVMDVSPALMEIALKIGMQLTIWACLNRKPRFSAMTNICRRFRFFLVRKGQLFSSWVK